jgi:hypothetical protein
VFIKQPRELLCQSLTARRSCHLFEKVEYMPANTPTDLITRIGAEPAFGGFNCFLRDSNNVSNEVPTPCCQVAPLHSH